METHGFVAHILLGVCYWMIIFLIATWTEADTVAHTKEHIDLLAFHWEPHGREVLHLSGNKPLVLKAGYLF